MRRTVLYVLLAAVVVAAVAGVLFLRAQQAPSAEQETRSAIVERGTLLVAVSVSGSIEPQTRVNLAFEVPGEVLEVLVKVGDKVKTGDVLARLDASQLALQVQQAEAALALAEAQLVQLREGPRPEQVAAALGLTGQPLSIRRTELVLSTGKRPPIWG